MGVPLSQRHVPALDGVRGLAILLVLACHTACVLPAHHAASAVLGPVLEHGQHGVDLFFVLSGYLISGILLDTRESAGYFRVFYWRRALRIFPAYYVYLLIVFAFGGLLYQWHGSDFHVRGASWPYLVYLQNWKPTLGLGDSLLSHLWSLAVEEQFYLVWPAVVYLMPRRGLAPLCVVLMLAAVGLRGTFAAVGWDVEHAHRITPARLDALLLGALLALAIRHDGWRAWCGRWLPRLGWPALPAYVVLYAVTAGTAWSGPLVTTVGWSLLALLSGALVFGAARADGGWMGRLFSQRWLRSFGRYSYGIYLLHMLVIEPVAWPWLRFLDEHSSQAYRLGIVTFPLLVVVGSYTLAWVYWHALEQWFLRLKNRVPYGEPAWRPDELERAAGRPDAISGSRVGVRGGGTV